MSSIRTEISCGPKGEKLAWLSSSLRIQKCGIVAYRSFMSEEYSARGVGKVTTGITGLWQPSVHSNVTF